MSKYKLSCPPPTVWSLDLDMDLDMEIGISDVSDSDEETEVVDFPFSLDHNCSSDLDVSVPGETDAAMHPESDMDHFPNANDFLEDLPGKFEGETLIL